MFTSIVILNLFTSKGILLTMADTVHIGLHAPEAVFISELRYSNRVFPWPFQSWEDNHQTEGMFSTFFTVSVTAPQS
jgi:hypothetical protein